MKLGRVVNPAFHVFPKILLFVSLFSTRVCFYLEVHKENLFK